jgi:C-terminal processing protease CtpA/Prc
VASLIVVVGLLQQAGFAQTGLSSYDRNRAKQMLSDIGDDVRKHYYDPAFHGVDWDAVVRQEQKKIDNSANMNEALSHVAAALDALNDSHTFFLPPRRPFTHDYGWESQIIGDRCYVTLVQPQSDAETKRLTPGDEVLAINGYVPDRTNFWKMEYVFNTLRPQAGLRLNLRDPDGNQRQLEVMAKVVQLKVVSGTVDRKWDEREAENQRYLMRARSAEMGDEGIVLKLPTFLYSESELDSMIGKARKHKSLILDLRGNHGGAAGGINGRIASDAEADLITAASGRCDPQTDAAMAASEHCQWNRAVRDPMLESLQRLVSDMFDHEVKIGDRLGRESKKPLVVKPGHHPFTGKLVVVVDSESASAAELFARLVQLEKRGIVLGDRSSGSVMEATRYKYARGLETLAFFGASITDADIVMTDGKSLEHTGVVPDQVVLPTATDLASGRDPVLARAAEMLGVKLTPEAAGKMFPHEWPK